MSIWGLEYDVTGLTLLYESICSKLTYLAFYVTTFYKWQDQLKSLYKNCPKPCDFINHKSMTWILNIVFSLSRHILRAIIQKFLRWYSNSLDGSPYISVVILVLFPALRPTLFCPLSLLFACVHMFVRSCDIMFLCFTYCIQVRTCWVNRISYWRWKYPTLLSTIFF